MDKFFEFKIFENIISEKAFLNLHYLRTTNNESILFGKYYYGINIFGIDTSKKTVNLERQT